MERRQIIRSGFQRHRRKSQLWLILAVCFLSGCGASTTSSSGSGDRTSTDEGGRIDVVATTGMVADLVRHVGGDRVNVKQIMGSGVDPHLYKATRDDVQKIMQADLVFYSGLMLEGKMADVFVKIARSKPVYAVTELIPEEQLVEPDGAQGHLDPHVWMDVAAWSKCIDVVENALSDHAPQLASEFQIRAAEYRTQLEKLHEYGQKSIATIPESSRILITSHDAFNYFGRAYSLEVVGVQGLSTESEAGLQRINELVDLIVDRKVKAVFVESSVSRKNIMALVEGAQSKGHSVEIGGELYSDAMGPDGSYEGTYIGMLDHNITTVTEALGGTVPEGGFQNQQGSGE
ncbi:Periplasmic zinc-binding protein TroA precursor [Thalassoglobus neptunius]|uniref:Periplasmic zinc-binding protein TroA n=1 Tax=Thalassoglobus neptunius TaxID=1938619 RepID=A0A5C5WYU2_9PLAN|nr:zinc ABC transporter substrate-binding protein [Thalassoglobus neptunius]TWT55758.1 Periplasmic zinc-binding protein TroA precursor [Thalassoglobus neptunius]